MTRVAPPHSDAVVDASVSLKWALDDEEAVAQTIALRDDAVEGRLTLFAPSLWYYEVINGLVTAARRRRLDPEIGRFGLERILALGVRLVDPEATAVYDDSTRFGIAAYDAAYLTLASALQIELWTGDRHFYDAVRRDARLVRWIGEYPIR